MCAFCQNAKTLTFVPQSTRLKRANKLAQQAVCQALHNTDRAQQLKSKARLLKQQQQQLAKQLQELSTEAEELAEEEQQEVQAELLTDPSDTPHNVEIPGAIKDFLAGAGVLDAVPWDGQPAVTRTTDIPYCQPPADQSYDWDYSSDSLTDAIQGETPDHALEQDKEASLLGEDGTEEGDSDADSDDEAGFVEDDKAPFEAGAGVEEIMQMLEEGGTLPDIEGLATAEDPQEFQRRVQKLVDRYEAQFQKKRDRKISTAEIREMEKEEAWEPTGRVPVLDEDILEVRPAPAVPDEVQQQYDALQQCLLVLRRAHLCGRPDEPVKALASAGLLDMEDVVYQDVLAKLFGVGPWLQYMEGLKLAGAWTQVEHVWAEVSDYRPNPVYKIMVDQFVNVPFPAWYYPYLRDNAPAEHWNEAGELEVPALLAVHNSAPSDPSVPLQKAYDTYSSHANKSASVQHTQQQSKHSSAQRQTGSNDQIAEDHAAASSSDMHAVFDTKPDRVEALNATSARHATVSMLPRLREIQRKARSDPDVQAALRQNLSQGADLDDDVQILPRVFYTDAAFAGSLMQQAVASSPAASDPALQELDENTKSQSSTSTPAGLSEQSLPTAYHQQTSESDNQRGSVDGALNESMRDVAKLDLLKLKISCGHMQWQADSSGSSNIGSEAFLPSIDLLQQFASPSGYEQPAGVSLDQQSAQGAASHHAQPEQQLQDHSGSLPGHVPHPQTGNAGEFANKGVSDKQSFSSDNEDSAEHKDDIRMLGTEPYDKDAMDPDLDREATLNLDGAQVLTPDGEWQRVNRKARVGSAWTKGECMTIGTTTEYELSAVSRKIICVTSGWGTIDAYALNVQDVMDAYIKAVGLDSFDMQAFVCAD